MKKSDLITTKSDVANNDSKLSNIDYDSFYVNCKIANDASKKLDFLILVIETLQINASDSLFLKPKILV